MDIILLERVENLGELGEEVTVKNGFARNFLLPRGKALIANDRNRARFAAERDIIEKRNADARAEAQQTGDSLDGTELVLIRQSSDTGNLYGSVSTRDIVDALAAAVTARMAQGDYRPLPENVETDQEGLRMEMVYTQ